MTRLTSTHLAIKPQPAIPLTPAQKKFNTLVKKIERQNKTLREWQEAEPLFAQRWNAECVPLQKEGDQLQLQLAQTLDQAMSSTKLTAPQRETAQDIVAGITQTLLSEQRLDAERLAIARALHDAHNSLDYDAVRREAQQEIRQQMQDMFDVELDGDIDLDDPAAMLHKLQQAMRDSMAEDDTEAEWLAKAPPSRTHKRLEAARLKKQQAQEAFEQQASQSLQVIFRRLASSLHPDRETDPVERQRKTELMQRVNMAYKENRLLDLLQLQLEVEQIDAGKLSQMAEQQLKHFIHMLQQQSADLQRQLMAAEEGLKMRYALNVERAFKPKDLPRIVVEAAFFLRQDVGETQSLLKGLQEPRRLKQWLTAQRQAMDADDALAEWLHAQPLGGWPFGR